MKESLKILVYFVALIVLGALLAPFLFWAGQWLGARVPSLKVLDTSEFQRYFNRSILISALILLLPMIRWMRIPGWQALGLRRDPEGFRHWLTGFGLAFAVMAALAAGLTAAGIWDWKSPLPWHRLTPVLATAAVVPVIEQFFFNGALLGLISRTANRWVALGIVSALYAIVHFLKPREVMIQDAQVTWLSGFHFIPYVFDRFSHPELVLAGFTSLFVLGWTFGYAAQKTRALALGMGLHAGIVLAKFSFTKLAKPDRKIDAMPWFGSELEFGIGSVLVLIFLFFLVWSVLRAKSRVS